MRRLDRSLVKSQMRVASLQSSFSSLNPPERHRIVIMALVVLLHALLLLLLLRLGPLTPLEEVRTPITVKLIPDPGAAPEPDRSAETPTPRSEEARQPQESVLEALIVPPADPPVAPRPSIWSQVIPLTRDEMATADRVLRSSPAATPGGASPGESQTASLGRTDDSTGPGTGPNGETLYNARWQREPTNAELNTYLPPGRRRSGWGIIACRTVPGNRVEDCHEIAQSPGSGLAGAVRRAAWQFRILPPRIGGRPIVGEWVRIRIDYQVTPAERESAAP